MDTLKSATTVALPLAAIVARGLRKSFGGLAAVDGVDLEVPEGVCFGLLGPNGAGKTTAIRMIQAQAPVGGGTLEVLGMDVSREPRRIKARLGIVPQENNLDPDFSVHRNLTVYARYFGIAPAEATRRADELLVRMSLQDKRDSGVFELSGGMKRRLVVARALVDHLTIIVCWQPEDEVPGALRVQWMLEMFPALRVVAHRMPSPHSVVPSAENLAAFAAQMRDIHPEPIERIFASDARQEPLAAALDARLVLVDPDHAAVPVRSSEIRTDPFASWPFIPPVVRPAYASTICLHGPESTGKTTLTQGLVDALGVDEATWVSQATSAASSAL